MKEESVAARQSSAPSSCSQWQQLHPAMFSTPIKINIPLLSGCPSIGKGQVSSFRSVSCASSTYLVFFPLVAPDAVSDAVGKQVRSC